MKVYGNGVSVVGDLHLSDIYRGSHLNYLSNCFYVIAKLVSMTREQKPACLILSGDVVGMYDRLIKRREVLCHVINAFKELNSICPVFAVRGNHDSGDFPEFSFLEGIGLIKTASSTDGVIDFFPDESFEVPEARFHLVDFGHEHDALDIIEGTTNIVVAHNSFTISGQTTWYDNSGGIELNSLTNWVGVDMVISGHIHNPSPMEIATSMANGEMCVLFYPGCPTRPTKDLAKYDFTHYVTFSYNATEGYTDWTAHPIPLLPKDEVFSKEALESAKTDRELDALDFDEMTQEQQDLVLDEERRESLKRIISDVVASNVTTSDPLLLISKYPNISERVRDICTKYYQDAVLAKNAKAH